MINVDQHARTVCPRAAAHSFMCPEREGGQREISILKELVQIQNILLLILVTYNFYLTPVRLGWNLV